MLSLIKIASTALERWTSGFGAGDVGSLKNIGLRVRRVPECEVNHANSGEDLREAKITLL